jgi:hypothetical protein
MDQIVRGYADRGLTPRLSVIDGGDASKGVRLDTLDRTLERCLLETQRQVHRLEEIVHRLSTAAARTTSPPAGVLSLIQESNRRLQQEVDEFSLDSHAVLKIVRTPGTPIAHATAQLSK